jgi:hypothetical protein
MIQALSVNRPAIHAEGTAFAERRRTAARPPPVIAELEATLEF